MASIVTRISEKIFNISVWHGVNEAPEGEARLRMGEAAKMRNFCVTSGGALKKRPGSRNVAGLLTGYETRTRQGEGVVLAVDRGLSQGYGMYPRVTADGMGTLTAQGEAVTVTRENAGEYTGYYFPKNGRVYAFIRCDSYPGAGTEAISGGRATPMMMEKLASGVETGTDPRAPGSAQGAEALEVYGEAYVRDDQVGVRGSVTRRERPLGTQTGFVTRDEGGYVLERGRLYRYYGAKVDGFTLISRWKKYSCQESGGEYLPREALGEVTAPRGEYPDADRGYAYAGTFSREGVTYTVMRLVKTLYCYVRDTKAGESYERAYSFWGFPLTVSADLNEWRFGEVYATAPGEAEDAQVRGIWAGFVGEREVLCAACSGALWELREEDGVWTKVSAGEMDTGQDVHMFGFDKKLYILNGKKYLVWDGERLREVEGYRPMVAVSVDPGGGGTLLENVNRLTGARRCRFSPDGEATVFRLPETGAVSVDWVKDPSGGAVPGYSADPEAGTVTFETPPKRGINSLEIGWTAPNHQRSQVEGMRFAELFNGAQDTRVFLYGDGSNVALYSGLDYEGRPRADYFPDLYQVAVGDANTPVTAMIRHYDKLMAFKTDSAWAIAYDTITLVDGTVTAGFYIRPVNRAIGNCAWGQAQLVQNRPRTLDGRSVIEWMSTGSSGITGDQRNAQRVSQRVDNTIRTFDLERARTFYDKYKHEYYVIGQDGTALVQNLDVDAWSVYTGLGATCMINYKDGLYYGTRDGFLRHFSEEYFSDNGEAIDALWESGAMSFKEDFRRKYSAMIWVGIKPEDQGYLEVTAKTDRDSDFAVFDVRGGASGDVPETQRIRLRARKFTYYKLILANNTADRTCTVVSADMRVRGMGFVR